MTNTNKKTIEGIRYIARNTQKMKVFDKVAYAFGNSAVLDLLNDAHDYQGRYEHEFSVYDSACIDYEKIDIETLKAKARKLAEDNEEIDEDEIDVIDYDDGEKGTFTLKEDEE